MKAVKAMKMNVQKVVYLNGNIKRIREFRQAGVTDPFIALSFQIQGIQLMAEHVEGFERCVEVLSAKAFPKKAMAEAIRQSKGGMRLQEEIRKAQEEYEASIKDD